MRHRVVLRRSEFSAPVRFTSRADFERAVRSDDQAVFESFASQTELEIFCIGANCPVSSLGVWKSRQSSVSRRASLLIWNVPSELRRAGSPPAALVIPIVARTGGLLFSVPEPFLDNDALLDAAMESNRNSPQVCVRMMTR